MSLAEGTVAFQNLQQTEVYQGQDTGRYTLTLSLEEDVASKLSDEGVKVKDYEGTAQRKFLHRARQCVPRYHRAGCAGVRPGYTGRQHHPRCCGRQKASRG